MLKIITRLPGLILLFSFFGSVFVSGCAKDLNDAGPGLPGENLDAEMVKSGVQGVVIDQNNQPMQGAVVTSGTFSTTTDRYGVFRFSNIDISKNNAHIQVKQTGYFTGHRTFVASAGRIHNVRIRLLPKTITGNFTSSAGGTVSLGTGGKIVMPANAVTDASGNVYNGSVNIAMTWIDPTAPDLPEVMMGDLRGITTSNEERGLATYGMLGVEMTGSGGQALKIATGKKAELTFPIPSSIAGAAPATIDLWHFDETKGRWIQEGTATRTGINYVAQVSHFSFWNCDAPFPVVNLCMAVVNATNNLPLNNVLVRIRRADGSYGCGLTDSTGTLCGKVPRNEPLTLEIMGTCNYVIYSQNIGPFAVDANLGTLSIVIPPNNQLTITGNLVNCSNANINNGSVQILLPNALVYFVPVTNGAFSLTIPVCSNNINYVAIGRDYTTLQTGNPVSGSAMAGAITNIGNIQACGSPIDKYIEALINATPNSFYSPGDSIRAVESAGNAPFSSKITIDALSSNVNIYNVLTFSFSSNGVPGTMLPMNSFYLNYWPQTNLPAIVVSPNPTVTITRFDPPGTGYIEGSFNVTVSFFGANRNFNCNFRVRRP